MVIGLILFVVWLVLPEAPEGYAALDDHVARLSLPDSLELVESGDEGESESGWFEERRTVVWVYASDEPAEIVCPSVQAALVEWGEIARQDVVEGGLRMGCGFSGPIAGEGNDTFEVDVMPVPRYVAERPSALVFWEGAVTTSFTTIVQVRALQDE